MILAEEKQPASRFPDWLLLAISAFAIFISPIGITGMKIILGLVPTITFPLVVPLEAILSIVGIIPLGILLARRKNVFALILVVIAILEIGLFFWFLNSTL